MDFTFEDALKSGGASATILCIVGIVYKVVSKFCGHRVRSECCGHEATAAVSVEVVERPQRPSLEPPKTSPAIVAVSPSTAPPPIAI